MVIILTIIASIGLIVQYLLDYFIKRKKVKHYVSITILLITICGVWGGFITQKNDNEELLNQLQTINKSNLKLQTTIELRNSDCLRIKEQNDSLKILVNDLSKSQKEFLIVSKKSVEEVSKSRELIKDISNKSFTRGISELDKIQMRQILSRYRGSKITITCMLNDSESFQFASEIKEVFDLSGWDTKGVEQVVYTNPINGIKINVHSNQYPVRVNGIVESLRILRLNAEGWLNEKLDKDDVELIIGSNKAS